MQLLANSFIENEESVLQFCNHIKLQPNIYLLTQLNTKYKLQTPINVERSSSQKSIWLTWQYSLFVSVSCKFNQYEIHQKLSSV